MSNLRIHFTPMGLVFALALTTFIRPPDASACTCPGQVTGGEPANGAVDVPTDVIPWVSGSNCGIVGRLLDASGAEVPTDPRSLEGDEQTHDTAAEFVPRAALSPGTHYALEVHVGSTSSRTVRIEFTTGSGVLGGAAPDAPTVIGEVATRTGATTSCGDHAVTCVSSREGGTLEVGRRDATGAFVGILMFDATSLSANDGYWLGEQATSSFCIAVRRRDLAGRRSPSVDLCSDSVAHYSVPGDGFLPITCANGLVLVNSERRAPDAPGSSSDGGTTGRAGGCSAAPRGARPAPVWAAGLGLLLVLAQRRATRGGRARTRSTTKCLTTTSIGRRRTRFPARLRRTLLRQCS